MAYEFEFGVFIGRFQPFHQAHLAILNQALKYASRVVVVLGSYNVAPDIRNPWSVEERKEMILSALSQSERERIIFLPIRDYLYNENLWLTALQEKVRELTDGSKSICLIGHESDRTSYYLGCFPRWKTIDYKPEHNLHATKIRNWYFTHDTSYHKFVPEGVIKYLEDFKKNPKFANLKDDYDYIMAYRESWRGAPFPPTFVTTDTVVIKSGHVLVVRRRGRPGKGLIALPGGFIKTSESIRKSAIRELKEETSINIDAASLLKSIESERVFDHPDRSLRGRTVTHGFCLNLGSGPLPPVKGSDDADKAWWMPLNETHLREAEFFEDHYHIITYFSLKSEKSFQ